MKQQSERVKALRVYLKKTQKEFSSELGVKSSYFSDIENSRRPITKKFVQRLNKAFGVSEEWVLNGVGKMYPKNVPHNVPSSENQMTITEMRELIKSSANQRLKFSIILYEDLKREYPELYDLRYSFSELANLIANLEKVFKEYIEPGIGSLELPELDNYKEFKRKSINDLQNYLKYKEPMQHVLDSIKAFIKSVDEKGILD